MIGGSFWRIYINTSRGDPFPNGGMKNSMELFLSETNMTGKNY